MRTESVVDMLMISIILQSLVKSLIFKTKATKCSCTVISDVLFIITMLSYYSSVIHDYTCCILFICYFRPDFHVLHVAFPVQLDLEFSTLVPDCCDFLREFPAVLEQLWKHASHSTLPAVRQAVEAAAGSDLGKIM